jgi:hypothetical protein
MFRRDRLFTLIVFSTLLLLEIVGRQTTSDLHDLVLAGLLCFLGLVVAMRHRREPLPWVAALVATATRLGQSLAHRFRFEIGIDLRGKPRVRPGFPPVFVVAAGLLGAWAGAAVAWWYAVPQGLRPIGVYGFYLGYLAGLTLLWAGMLACIGLGGYMVVGLIHDAVANAFGGAERRRKRLELISFSLYFGTLLVAGAVFPTGLALALCGGLLVVALALLAFHHGTEVQFLWRRAPGSAVRAVPWSRGIIGTFVLIGMLLIDLVLSACGGRVLGNAVDSREVMPLTTAAGTFLAWLAPGVLGVLVAHICMGRMRDPARPSRPIAHILGPLDSGARAKLRQTFGRHSWRARFEPARVGANDVRVEIVSPEQSQAEEFEPRWPLRLSPADLEAGAVFDRLARRDEIQLRRRILAAMRRLFKFAGQRTHASGSGYWMAPHFWFIPGLTRDESDEESERGDGSLLSRTVGPPFHQLLTRAERHHLYRVLRATQVDLIFVEDGVRFKKLTRVLRALFEVYDKGAGRKRAEEVHFRGLPGLRVLIHEFQFDHPFRSSLYPEPKFEEFSRARVLHVFRDRGEHEEWVEPPADFSTSPVPMLVG